MTAADDLDVIDDLPAGARSIDRQPAASRPACRVCGNRPACDCGHEPEGVDDIERRYQRYQQRDR